MRIGVGLYGLHHPIVEPVVVDPERPQMGGHLHNARQQIDDGGLGEIADRVILLDRQLFIDLQVELDENAVPGVARPQIVDVPNTGSAANGSRDASPIVCGQLPVQ